MTNYYTENLAEFGYREIKMLTELLNAWTDKGLPEGFYYNEVRPAMNKSSGNVFLVNSEYQVAMLNGDSLELFHSLPYGGAEGFLSDLISEQEPENLNSDDVEYILNEAEAAHCDLPEKWLAAKLKLDS